MEYPFKSYCPADFSSNPDPTHLPVIIKWPRTPWLAGSGLLNWGWSWNLQDSRSPAAALEIPGSEEENSSCFRHRFSFLFLEMYISFKVQQIFPNTPVCNYHVFLKILSSWFRRSLLGFEKKTGTGMSTTGFRIEFIDRVKTGVSNPAPGGTQSSRV